MCFMFQTRAFWKCMRVPTNKLNNRFEFFFGAKNIEISNRNDAKNLLLNIVTTIQNEMIDRMLDGELRETQTADYFSGLCPIDCAVPSLNA